VTPCISSTKNRKTAIPYDKTLYQERHKVESMYPKLKDWRRIATRYDRCAYAGHGGRAICQSSFRLTSLPIGNGLLGTCRVGVAMSDRRVPPYSMINNIFRAEPHWLPVVRPHLDP
jgi:hypothetical protein